MNLEERREIRQELSKLGFKGDYLDGWQPRVNCWRHRPHLNVDGFEVAPAGEYVPNQPGDPYTTVKMARNAVLPWPPTKDCRCKSCRERDWSQFVINAESEWPEERQQVLPATVPEIGAFTAPKAETKKRQKMTKCPDCDFIPPKGKNASHSINAHRRHMHQEVVVG